MSASQGVSRLASAQPLSGLKRPARLADQVYQQILEQIVDGSLPPGGRLPSETELAHMMSVSRPVIRDAIARLQADAVVFTRKGSGTYVKQRPGPAVLKLAPAEGIADLMRCFELRIALEGDAAALAAERRTKDDMKDIETALTHLDRVVDRQELGIDADIHFHSTIARATKNQFFIEQLVALSVHMFNGMNLTRRLSLARKKRRQLLVQDEHRGVVKAIRNQDSDVARTLMRLHLDNARKRALDASTEPA